MFARLAGTNVSFIHHLCLARPYQFWLTSCLLKAHALQSIACRISVGGSPCIRGRRGPLYQGTGHGEGMAPHPVHQRRVRHGPRARQIRVLRILWLSGGVRENPQALPLRGAHRVLRPDVPGTRLVAPPPGVQPPLSACGCCRRIGGAPR